MILGCTTFPLSSVMVVCPLPLVMPNPLVDLVADLPKVRQLVFFTVPLLFAIGISPSHGYTCRGALPLCLDTLVSTLIPGFAGLPCFSLLDFILDALAAKDFELRFAIAFRAAILASESHWSFSKTEFGRR